MSTRSFIARELDNNLLEGIYCHWDGGLKGVGRILKNFYDQEKTKELIKLGNISSLCKKLNPETSFHSFDHPEKDVTVAYLRDRKEKDNESVVLSLELPIEQICPYADVEWFYLLEKSGHWLVKYYTWNSWLMLSDVVSG